MMKKFKTKKFIYFSTDKDVKLLKNIKIKHKKNRFPNRTIKAFLFFIKKFSILFSYSYFNLIQVAGAVNRKFYNIAAGYKSLLIF